MKVKGSNKGASVRGASKTGKKPKSSTGNFGSMIDATPEIEANASLTGTASIGQLDALLSLQETNSGTPEEAAERGKKHAGILLDMMDQIRMGLLTGGIPKSSLQQLTHMVAQHRENIMDPHLAEIIDEIDLRAQVELAKHSKQ